MVGLPDLVRPFGLAAMNQVVGLAIGLLAIPGLGSSNLQGWRESARRSCGIPEAVPLAPARRGKPPGKRHRGRTAALQGETFGEPEQIFRDMPLALI
jgi:hypothetical protein